MKSGRTALAFFVVCASLVAWSERRLSAQPWPYPPVTSVAVTENYLGDIGALLLGAHRIAGDIAYIQFLQYYGVSENENAEEEAEAAGKRFDLSEGRYPLLLDFAMRLVHLDPYFNGPVLEASGALAFNQHRPHEAKALLTEGIKLDPSFYRYHLYLTSILFKESGDDAGLIGLLLEAIKYPDCPPLFQLMLGNLLKKTGRYEDAAHVFIHTLQTAPQDYDRKDAARRLTLLMSERPEVAKVVTPALQN